MYQAISAVDHNVIAAFVMERCSCWRKAAVGGCGFTCSDEPEENVLAIVPYVLDGGLPVRRRIVLTILSEFAEICFRTWLWYDC